jgi:dihydrolipoamide dehydrogenase
VAKQLNQGVTHLMKKNKIDILHGCRQADCSGKARHRQRQDDSLTAKTHHHRNGCPRARPAVRQGRRKPQIWTYRTAMTPKEQPSKLLVIGSGAIGIEFASFYNDHGHAK